MAVSDTYPTFIEPTITWVPSGFSGYMWLDTKIVIKIIIIKIILVNSKKAIRGIINFNAC